MANNDKILERVRALLAIAEHPNTPAEEADTAMTQANRLMTKHAILEATARAAQTREERRAVERKEFKLHNGPYIEFLSDLRTVFAGLCRHNRVEAVIDMWGGVTMFGTHDDLVWVEQLYTTVYFEFLSRLQPKWDNDKSYDENVYNFKLAGYPWKDIDAVAVRAGHASRQSVDKYGFGTGYFHKIFAAYNRHRKLIGDDRPVKSQTHSQYRRDFSRGFVARILARLEKMAADAAGEIDETAAVVLYDMKQEIKDVLYAEFPDMHPDARSKAVRQYQQEQEAREEADRQARETMLNAMTDKQRETFLDKERRAEERQARIDANYWRKQALKGRDRDGRAAGDRAGRAVSLDRNAGAASASSSQKELA